jgi:hypothetical protein
MIMSSIPEEYALEDAISIVKAWKFERFTIDSGYYERYGLTFHTQL